MPSRTRRVRAFRAEHQRPARRMQIAQRLGDLGRGGGGDQVGRRAAEAQGGQLGEQDGGGHVGKGRE